MKKEICEKCRHCLSCMCGEEFDDCKIRWRNEMIKVIEEKPVPRATIECKSCGSILEYGNADLSEYTGDYYASLQKYFYFKCPICGCKVVAPWINKKEKQL